MFIFAFDFTPRHPSVGFLQKKSYKKPTMFCVSFVFIFVVVFEEIEEVGFHGKHAIKANISTAELQNWVTTQKPSRS